MRWRVGLIDSGAAAAGVVRAARFAADGARADGAGPDPTGHGTRVAALLRGAAPDIELVLAQVFAAGGPTSAAAVAAAIDWCVAEGAQLVHLSLGLAADRAPLAEAVARAVGAGRLVVAATPARGPAVYPAAYPGVIRATGDARCAPDEISRLAAATFGGCVRTATGAGQGASVGAAAVSRALLAAIAPGSPYALALQALGARARYDGPERRRRAAPRERGDP